MALLDLLGRRWALRLIWELREAALSFRELQERCGRMSSSVLNQRLTELRAAGIVETGDGGYALTAEGARLLELYPPIQDWADRWAVRASRAAVAGAPTPSKVAPAHASMSPAPRPRQRPT